jgi:Na+/H+ antiporter NhaD/arsenite permease-like protein
VWRGVLVFAVTYVLVASKNLRVVKVDRPAGALIGAVLAVALGALTPDEAAKAVDHTTIVLLFAVMGMGAFLSLDGFLERLGERVIGWAKTPRRLVAATVWGAGILSAIVTNDAICVLVAPIVVGWIEKHKLPRLPLLLALATGANTGSVATLVGNPQNMLCGSLGHLRFDSFLLHMAPVAVIGLAINHIALLLIFRSELASKQPIPIEPPAHALFTMRSALTVAVILGTVVCYTAGTPLSFTALGSFGLLIVVHRTEPGRVWERIDWAVLLFFGGLFVSVEALAKSGAAAWAFRHFPLVGAGEGAEPGSLGWIRAAVVFLIGSNVVTNVPFILVVRTEMARLADATLGWEMLAMASTFAGNLSLLGSVANVIVAEKAKSVGGLRFGEYLKAGVPVATITTLVGALLLYATR